MSQTLSVGVVGPSYWSYMSAAMAECLKRAAEKRRIDSGDIPAGVYNDAKRFFSLVTQEIRDGTPENPPASINAYVIAADVMRGCAHPGGSWEELKRRLESYWTVVEALQNAHELDPSELVTLNDLRQFFLRLRKAGEAESYERRIRFEPEPARRLLMA